MQATRRSFLVSSAALAAATALGLRPEQVMSAENGVLRVAVELDIATLDPGYMVGGTESTVLFATLPSLARPRLSADGVWGWEPSEYVESIEQTDELHIPFRLKQGLMWSDGAGELTADDVKFSFERMPASDWGNRWSQLDHVEVTDRYSGVIVLKSPFVAIWMVAIAYDSGFILPKSKVEALPDQRFGSELPAQLGPYRLVEWVPKQKIVLKADETWPGTRPAFPTVELLVVADTKAGELALQAGEVSVADLQSETAANFDRAPLPGIGLLSLPGSYYQWIGLNIDHPKLADPRVRQAIQRAIDVESILVAAYSGLSPKATGIVPDGILGHRPAAGYGYDPAAAKALLAEAGVAGLSLELRYDVTGLTDAIVAQVAQANLADVGIEVQLLPLDSGPYWNLGLESKGEEWKQLQLTVMAYRTGPDPADAMQWFVSNQVGVWNWERWKSPEFDALWNAALAEADTAARGELYVRMQQIMEDTGCYVWITYPTILLGVRQGLTVDFYPGGDYRVEGFKA